MKRMLMLTAISTAVCGVIIACDDTEESSTEGESQADNPPPERETEAAEGEGEGEATEGEAAEGESEAAEGEGEAAEGEAAAPLAATGEDQSELDCEADDVDCPLFTWMNGNMLPVVEADEQDLAALAKVLHKVEFLVPEPSWNEDTETGWSYIARTGATKAEAGEWRGARRACRNCHRTWRDRFREEGRRLSAMPELPDNAEEGNPELSTDG